MDVWGTEDRCWLKFKPENAREVNMDMIQTELGKYDSSIMEDHWQINKDETVSVGFVTNKVRKIVSEEYEGILGGIDFEK